LILRHMVAENLTWLRLRRTPSHRNRT
jgi:hypothetical protein